MFDIQEELKKLPGKPGVYIMHDARDAIIYIGKAISLRNRVRQYFRAAGIKARKSSRWCHGFPDLNILSRIQSWKH